MGGKAIVKDDRYRELAARFVPGDGTPWMPQDGENVLDYYRFKFYLEMGPARDLRVVADEFDIPLATLRATAKRNDWDARCGLYESHLCALEFRARDEQTAASGSDWVDRRAQIRERAYAASRALFEKAALMLEYPLETVTEEVVEEQVDGVPTTVRRVVRMPVKWGMRDAASMLEMADRMGRLAADMPTSNARVTVVERKVELAVRMVVNLMTEGKEPERIRALLREAQVEQDVVDAAFRVVEEGQ